MLVLAEVPPGPISPVDIQLHNPLRMGDRVGRGCRGAAARRVWRGLLIVEVPEFPERVQEVALVPDERAVQELRRQKPGPETRGLKSRRGLV